MKKDLLSIKDLSTQQILALLTQARSLKKEKNFKKDAPLKGRSIGLLFQKPSNRTRVSFEVGIHQLGGNCIYLSPEEIDLGRRETVSDVAKTLSRYLDCLVARTFTHQDLVDLAQSASIPVINGLSDLYHPCQGLADLMTIQEHFGSLKDLTLSYIGDGNNVCHSLLMACSKSGVNINMATPKHYEPNPEVLKLAYDFAKTSKSKVLLTHSPKEAVVNSHIIYSDVWVSMGQEAETKRRLQDFEGYQINEKLVTRAHKDFIFMHCLPAHRGLEVTEEVIDGKHSVVFDQAENRLHIQKAILLLLLT